MKFSDINPLQQLSELSTLLCHCVHQHEAEFVGKFLPTQEINDNSIVLSVAGDVLFVTTSRETEFWLHPIEKNIVAIPLQEVYDWLDEVVILENLEGEDE